MLLYYNILPLQTQKRYEGIEREIILKPSSVVIYE
jgi:hypothetical protein